MDDNHYLTTYEAALAVVATGMKKARLKPDTLVINAIIGAMLFSVGGMLNLVVHSVFPGIKENNPGLLRLLQGSFYPIGLFYVVVMGAELFNANVLFFTVALCRRGISVLDLLINWFITWWFNLVGNIFVGYIISHFSNTTSSDAFIEGSHELLASKMEYSFVQNLIKGMAGNFFVCMAIHLQIMAKPLHVKFLMLYLPILTFISLDFTHCVADMYIVIIGKINHSPAPWGEICWKLLLPGTIGNIIGGVFFGIVICWYMHIYVVERDKKELNLPIYEFRDQQPELMQDSRVVRQKDPIYHDDVEAKEDAKEKNSISNSNDSSGSEVLETQSNFEPRPFLASHASAISRLSNRRKNSLSSVRSPRNVFPVYGMEEPLTRERTIAGDRAHAGEVTDEANDDNDDDDANEARSIGSQLVRIFTTRSRKDTSNDC
ncbi:Formate/nitrite transporter family protein [Candida parapsilosis]|uniref:Formate/nitrite transporter n=2 Tax=Candida parapsilosis TaxID=5480 RepID=G8B5C6_CANPC|nr:uncharacterized protein CPAR2_602360 [Candida parapsilosis]KAF6043517.1 Formate/nitrite transporter family protein [Candida parapsilosis]KAF6043985.1 Formate/nitrite transporter family protein [Candida parapsilosis]KAF6045395.1 Formate/nitrite transporter family protein [Candida parapsilosis]KAF6060181.1 Formate/nitrite transporter family protein [Candida parapsilosis]KAI5901602.1 putative transporter [Candida parapsilosis]